MKNKKASARTVKGESMLPRYHLDLNAQQRRVHLSNPVSGIRRPVQLPAARKWLLSAPDKDLHRMSSLYGTADGKLVSS